MNEMNFVSFILSFMSNFWYVFPIAIVLGILKSNWFKGKCGEFTINLSTKLSLDSNVYHLIKDVTIPVGDGTTQIDHIIVSIYGVFVVETKNLKGWIFGSENKPQWTQKIFKETYKFQNPLRQNFKHVAALREMLDLTKDQIHSIVVFVGDSKFKTPMPDNVVNRNGYIRFVKSQQTPVIDADQVSVIIDKIESGKLTRSISTNRKHRQYLSEKKDNHSCPTCGSSMILRESKKGANVGQQFWGCSTFPKCRGTVKV